MIRNYFKTAFRNLSKQRGSNVLNILGLSLGLTSSIILFLMVSYMLSFNKEEPNYDRVYRIVMQSDGNEGKSYTSGVPSPLPPAFRLDFPEAEAVAFTQYHHGTLVLVPRKNAEPKKFQESEGVVYTESTIYDIFPRTAIVGDPIKSLDEPNEAVITKSYALRYFERVDVIGETLKVGEYEYRIGAVLEDHNDHTDLPFDLYLSYETIRKENEEHGWNSIWSDEHCYFLLKEGESVDKLQSRMQAFTNKYLGEDDWNNSLFVIQPLSEIHYDERFGTYSRHTASESTIIAISITALFLVISACINFINLSTAEAIKRSKEVGIRKTLGSTRIQLVSQFLGETSLVTLIAIIVSLGLTQLGLSFVNPFLDLNLSLDFVNDPIVPAFLFGLFLFVTIFSGLYPSMVLSGFRPVLALKNKISSKSSSSFHLRRALVVVQFVISQFFIIGTIVVISQMNYFMNKDLGFNKDAIITIPIPERETPAYENNGASSKMRTLATQMGSLSNIYDVSLCNAPPASGSISGTNFQIEGRGDDLHMETQVKLIDGNYVPLFELELIAGENIADLDTAGGFIVNEKLTEIAGFENPADIIGSTMILWGKRLPVVGVIKNFHATNLRRGIEPVALFNHVRSYRTIALKVNGDNYQGSIDEVKKLWEAAYPEHIFSYEFLDEEVAQFYENEKKMSIMLTVFTSMAILIGCLGLFGLATFMANQKTKEIGVRKVLGASVEGIVFMFSKEYARLLIVGFVLASVLAWFAMTQWLETFAYRIDFGAWIYVAGLGVTALIALLTVGYRSYRAASANPVKSLRYE